MFKNTLWLLVGVLVGAVSMYKLKPHSYESWQPVIEETRFDYLRDILDSAIPAADSLSLQAGQSPAARTLRSDLAKLQRYYLPLTEVRQLIFDADRFYYLKEKERAEANLQQAIRLLEQVQSPDHPALNQALDKLILLIKKTLLDVQSGAPELNKSFRQAGHRVNMMLYRGELILSDERF